ncbi:alpha/beta hydrolase [Lysobacter sp. TY2-98]|uniref:alpha/beta hydrolase n=1 Tax=Lysobacter sp. TY2-98 TaxID=2290922 RepID=UPI000E2083D3|nr:alpha/beta hydrolase [Lysobacter sp. TY2-98]AXK72076.1 alpha/beta hydrolase [Lysobacter sp. TY2-98]
MRLLRWSFYLLAASALLACVPTRADSSRPIATALLPSKAGSHRLVVVLPGRRDRLESLRRSGVGEAIQRAWPDADVLFAELSMPYYVDRTAPQRLHDEVLMPARRRAYTEIWLVGASLGGMGSILYDGMYPEQVDGIVLLAPYTGEREIHDEIRAAGGLGTWRPETSAIDPKSFWQRDLWAQMKTWREEPERVRNVWLAYGDNDYLREGMPLVADALPRDHVLVQPGKHAWSTWTPMTESVFRAIDAERSRTARTR